MGWFESLRPITIDITQQPYTASEWPIYQTVNNGGHVYFIFVDDKRALRALVIIRVGTTAVS